MIRNKKGSVTIYILLFSTTIIWMVSAYINAAENILVQSGAYALGDVWGASILGEYDLELYKRYGFLSYYGDEGQVGNKLSELADYTFGRKRYASCEIERVNLYEYALIDTDNFLNQIREICVADKIEGFLDGGGRSPLRYSYGDDESVGEPRALSGEALARSLPSYGRGESSLLDRAKDYMSNISSLQDVVKIGTDTYVVNSYIGEKFRNIYYAREGQESYLFGEQEYIIAGRNSDEGNRKAVRNRIIALREVMNFIFIEENEDMYLAALAAGEILSLGYAPEVAAQIVIAAWALAESINDYELLIKGKPVPLYKTRDSWAIDVESVMENTETGCVDTGNRSGDYYNDYIEYLLCFTDLETKLLRIMDLIQINMRHTYCSTFLLSEYYVGLDYTLRANGKEYEFHSEY